jgi:hypothetical protein
VPIGAILEKIE